MRKTFVMVAVLGGLLVVGLWLYAVLASSDSPQRPSAPTAQAEKFADSAEMKKQKSMEVKKGRSEPRIDRPDLPCRDPATFPSMVATPPGAPGQGAEPPARRDAGPPSAGGFSVPPGTTLVGPSPQIQIPPAALLSPPQDWGTRDAQPSRTATQSSGLVSSPSPPQDWALSPRPPFSENPVIPKRSRLALLAQQYGETLNDKELDQIIGQLEKIVTRRKAALELKKALERIVREFPGTPAADSARQMLDQQRSDEGLWEPGSPPKRVSEAKSPPLRKAEMSILQRSESILQRSAAPSIGSSGGKSASAPEAAENRAAEDLGRHSILAPSSKSAVLPSRVPHGPQSILRSEPAASPTPAVAR